MPDVEPGDPRAEGIKAAVSQMVGEMMPLERKVIAEKGKGSKPRRSEPAVKEEKDEEAWRWLN